MSLVSISFWLVTQSAVKEWKGLIKKLSGLRYRETQIEVTATLNSFAVCCMSAAGVLWGRRAGPELLQQSNYSSVDILGLEMGGFKNGR